MNSHKGLCKAMVRNTYEASVSSYFYQEVSDLCPGSAPAGCLVILDAEMEFIAYVSAGKADVLVKILNAAEEYAPDHYGGCESEDV